MYNVFHMLLLEQENTRKRWMNEFADLLEFETGDNKEYEVKAIRDNIVYAKEANKYLLKLYYLVTRKGYLKEENTWESSSIVMYLWKMVSTFHKDYPEKPTVISVLLDSAPSMAKPII